MRAISSLTQRSTPCALGVAKSKICLLDGFFRFNYLVNVLYNNYIKTLIIEGKMNFKELLNKWSHDHKIRMHGVYDQNEVIELKTLDTESPDTINVNIGGQSREVTKAEYDTAVNKLRSNYIFPEITVFPVLSVVNPNIKLNVLKNVGDLTDLVNNPLTTKEIYIPNENHQYCFETNCISYFGHTFPVDDNLKAHFLSGRKIAILINSNKDLVWLKSHEYVVLQTWGAKKAIYQERVDRIAQVIEQASKLPVTNLRETGIFANLSFDVVGVQKINISGLSESSFGDGRKSNTVNHLLVLPKPLQNYTNKEQLFIGSPLCGPQQGKNMGLGEAFGVNYAAQSLEESGITCKACLKKMKVLLGT